MHISIKHLAVFILFGLILSCTSRPKVIQPTIQPVIPGHAQNVLQGQVLEFEDASRYTYVKLGQNQKELWIAIPQTKLQKGETIYYQGGIMMDSFESEELGRVFDTLLLVSSFGKTPDLINEMPSRGEIDMHGGTSEPLTEEIEQPQGGTSLSELFGNPEKYNDRIILVKGKCVKVNRNIMGKNWVHLQDGSTGTSGKTLDLTITTKEDIPLGAIVSLEGIIKVDRDFGAGYTYDVIMEDALLND